LQSNHKNNNNTSHIIHTYSHLIHHIS
jgi:hypothetical protein